MNIDEEIKTTYGVLRLRFSTDLKAHSRLSAQPDSAAIIRAWMRQLLSTAETLTKDQP